MSDERREEREERRRARHESRSFRRELEERVHEEARRVRREAQREARRYRNYGRQTWHRPRHGFGPATPLVLALLALALSAARVATWALFQVFLPSLLFALSLLGGRGLRRAAFRCREVGIVGDDGLRRAMAVIRERMLGQELDQELDEEAAPSDADRSSTPKTRTRVAAQPAPHPVPPEQPEFDEDSTAPSERRTAR